MRVQLLSFPGCPNVEAARDVLCRALAQAGLPLQFEEVDVSAPGVPDALRGWGSPSVLINGRDVAGAEPTGVSCRRYDTPEEGQGGVPSSDLILYALNHARRGEQLDRPATEKHTKGENLDG